MNKLILGYLGIGIGILTLIHILRRLILSSKLGSSNIKLFVHCVIFGALRINKNCVILDFIIATLPVNLFKILFTHFLTTFHTPPLFCVA